MSSAGQKAIVAGATGSLGRLIVQTLLDDPRVDHVTAVVRKPVSPEKAQELWGNNINTKLTQHSVQYNQLVQENGHGPMTEQTQQAFRGHTAFLTALGAYSGRATEAEMDMVETSYNTSLAKIAASCNVARGAYMSGQGVKQPALEGRAFAAFGRVKGRTEESLAHLFPQGHFSVRPGAIFDRPGPPVYGFLDGTLLKSPIFQWLKDTSFGISAHDIAKGMVQGALFDKDKTGNVIWENNEVREAARRYDANLPAKQ